MTGKEHANLLGIFAWIYAGLQSLVVILYVLFVLLYGGLGLAMAMSSDSSDAGGAIFMGLFVALFALIGLIGLSCVISNIWLGKRLRSNSPPTVRSMVVTAILNFISWVCGGVFLMPFGLALGGYSLWLAMSETGRAFLENREMPIRYAFPSEAQYHPIGHAADERQAEPYRWR